MAHDGEHGARLLAAVGHHLELSVPGLFHARNTRRISAPNALGFAVAIVAIMVTLSVVVAIRG
jgi:hypothetical protein